MLLTDLGHLSIWEVAHRWHDADPNLTDPKALPLTVQDTLRTITRLQYRHELPVCSTTGVVRKNERTLVDYENFAVQDDTYAELDENGIEIESDGPEDRQHPSLSDDERWERYEEFCEHWLRRHNEAVQSFPRCFDHREFDKAQLEQVHIDQESVREMCEKLEQPLPAFWFSPQEVEEHNRLLKGERAPDEDNHLGGRINQTRIDAFWVRLSPKQQHRLLCRAIAAEIWRTNPNASIADICRDDAILNFGGGRYYTKPDTLREWIKDLDPRPDEEKKGGRPANK